MLLLAFVLISYGDSISFCCKATRMLDCLTFVLTETVISCIIGARKDQECFDVVLLLVQLLQNQH